MTPTRDTTAGLWSQLVSGEFVIVASTTDDVGCDLLLSRTSDATATSLEGLRALVTQAVLLGEPQKALAIDLGCSAGTISTMASGVLGQIGVPCSPSRSPLAVVLAATAHWLGCSDPICAEWERDGTRYLRLTRPDSTLAPLLSKAEFEVVQLLIEGLSHDEIAERRGRSARTIANQLHDVFERLHAKGRFQIVRAAMLPRSRSFRASSPIVGDDAEAELPGGCCADVPIGRAVLVAAEEDERWAARLARAAAERRTADS